MLRFGVFARVENWSDSIYLKFTFTRIFFLLVDELNANESQLADALQMSNRFYRYKSVVMASMWLQKMSFFSSLDPYFPFKWNLTDF